MYVYVWIVGITVEIHFRNSILLFIVSGYVSPFNYNIYVYRGAFYLSFFSTTIQVDTTGNVKYEVRTYILGILLYTCIYIWHKLSRPEMMVKLVVLVLVGKTTLIIFLFDLNFWIVFYHPIKAITPWNDSLSRLKYKFNTHTHNNNMVNNIFISTHLNVHHILKHIVLSQKNAARKTKCITIAETKI